MKDVVADLHLGFKELAAEDRAGWSALGLSDRLRDVEGLHEAAQVELIRTLAGWDRRVAWAEDGAVTAVAWLKQQLGMAGGEAAALVRMARLYDEHPVIADALDGGHLTVAKLRILVRAAAHREEMFAACVEGLVELGAKLSLADFTQVLGEWADVVDEQKPKDESDRSMRAHHVGEGGRVQLDCSRDDLTTIIAALEALDSPDPKDGPQPPRTREQRWHDLTIDLFRRVLVDQHDQDPGAPGSVDVIIDVETAVELVADPQVNRPAEDPLADVLQPYRDADLETLLPRRRHHPDGARAGRAFAAVLLCTGVIRRVIVDPRTGDVLDIGRSQRRFTKRQVRALVVRDGGCVFPGCDRKPKWCDAHHMRPWEDGGPTDLDNGCLLCRRHHTLVHHGGWTLQRDRITGVFTATAPNGRTFTRRPDERC